MIPLLDRLAYALGFEYPPALLLMLAVVGLMLIILQLSLNISNQAEHLKVLTQEFGLLRQEMDALAAKVEAEAKIEAGSGSRSTRLRMEAS